MQCLEKLYPITLTSNADEHARLDISAKGFWNTFHELALECSILWPKVIFNQSLSSCYHKNENEKKRAYGEYIQNVKHGTFTPLVSFLWQVVGSNGLKCLASLFSEKTHQTYNQTIHWLHCSLSFSCLQSMIMSLKGARSSCGKLQLVASDISLAVSEARLMWLLCFCFACLLFNCSLFEIIEKNWLDFLSSSVLKSVFIIAILLINGLICRSKKSETGWDKI